MIDDDELILYHYNDGLGAARRQQITQCLRNDLDLARRYQQLRAQLAQLPLPAEAQPRPAALARWRLRLDQAAAAPCSQRRPPAWPMALAAATLMLLGVAIGTRIAEQTPAPVESVQPLADAGSALNRGVRSHFGDTRMLLASLQSEDPAHRKALLADVIEQNRLFQQAAERQGDERLARVLRALEPVFAALAEDTPDSAAAASARSQLDFELAVMQTKLSRSPSKIVQSL
jgi:anti-sigma-K factor RskA